MGPTPVYGARAEKPPQNADFAMMQTNIICRLSGDINELLCYRLVGSVQQMSKHLKWASERMNFKIYETKVLLGMRLSTQNYSLTMLFDKKHTLTEYYNFNKPRLFLFE